MRQTGIAGDQDRVLKIFSHENARYGKNAEKIMLTIEPKKSDDANRRTSH